MSIQVNPGATVGFNLTLANGSTVPADIGVNAELRVKSGSTWVPFTGAWSGAQNKLSLAAGAQATWAFNVVFPSAEGEYAFVFDASIKRAGAAAGEWALVIDNQVAGESAIVRANLVVVFVAANWA